MKLKGAQLLCGIRPTHHAPIECNNVIGSLWLQKIVPKIPDDDESTEKCIGRHFKSRDKPSLPLQHLQAQVLRIVPYEIHLFALILQQSSMLVLDPKPHHPHHPQFCILQCSFRWIFRLAFHERKYSPIPLKGNYNTPWTQPSRASPPWTDGVLRL